MPITISDKLRTRTNQTGWWLGSALAHLVVVGFWLHLSSAPESRHSGDVTQSTIQVSVVTPVSPVARQEEPAPNQALAPRKPNVTPTKPDSETVATTQANQQTLAVAKVDAENTTASTPVTPAAKSHPEKFSSMLHQAIDRYKQYPRVALRMRQQGTARIRFRLFEDGRVEDITLLQTSGYQSLDHSALHAVESIAPFTPAREYLTDDEQFYVDIVFRI